MYRISQDALEKITKKEHRKALADKTKRTESAIYKAIRTNAPDGFLTTHAVIEEIGRITGLETWEILEEVQPVLEKSQNAA